MMWQLLALPFRCVWDIFEESSFVTKTVMFLLFVGVVVIPTADFFEARGVRRDAFHFLDKAPCSEQTLDAFSELALLDSQSIDIAYSVIYSCSQFSKASRLAVALVSEGSEHRPSQILALVDQWQRMTHYLTGPREKIATKLDRIGAWEEADLVRIEVRAIDEYYKNALVELVTPDLLDLVPNLGSLKRGKKILKILGSSSKVTRLGKVARANTNARHMDELKSNKAVRDYHHCRRKKPSSSCRHFLTIRP